MLRGFEFWGSGTTPTSGAFWGRKPEMNPIWRTFEGRRPEITHLNGRLRPETKPIWTDIQGPKARDETHLADGWGPKAWEETYLCGRLRADGLRRNPSERTFEGRRPETKPIWTDIWGPKPKMTPIWSDVWGPRARDETHLSGRLSIINRQL